MRVGKIVKAQIYPGKKVRIPVAAEMLEDGWLRFSVSLPDSTANTNASPAAAPIEERQQQHSTGTSVKVSTKTSIVMSLQ